MSRGNATQYRAKGGKPSEGPRRNDTLVQAASVPSTVSAGISLLHGTRAHLVFPGRSRAGPYDIQPAGAPLKSRRADYSAPAIGYLDTRNALLNPPPHTPESRPAETCGKNIRRSCECVDRTRLRRFRTSESGTYRLHLSFQRFGIEQKHRNADQCVSDKKYLFLSYRSMKNRRAL